MLTITGVLLMDIAVADQLEIKESELVQIVASEPTRDKVQRIELAVSADSAPELLGVLKDIEEAPQTSPIARAYLRYTALMAFGSVSESKPARLQLLGYLSGNRATGPEIRVLREDDGHRGSFIVFDPVAAARFSLGAWNANAWTRRARADLAAGRQDFLSEWLSAQRRAGGRLSASGVIEALSLCDPGELIALPALLRSQLAAGEPVAELARVVAIRLMDAPLAHKIINAGDSTNALNFLSEMDEFPVEKRLELLEFAAERFELGSAAMYGMARLDTPASRRALMARLGSEELGTSAAAALARYPSANLAEDLAAVVTSDDQAMARRRAVLALHLLRDHAGMDMLRSLSRNPNLSSDLRKLITDKLQ